MFPLPSAELLLIPNPNIKDSMPINNLLTTTIPFHVFFTKMLSSLTFDQVN